MEKIKTGDIVVSMIAQTTESGYCPIPMGYVSKAIVNDDYDGDVIWFEETTSGEGNYPANNFRLATAEEARLKWPCTLPLYNFDFLPGDLVSTYNHTGTVVGISISNINPSYLVKLNTPLEVNGHNGNVGPLFIGSIKELNNDGWYYDAIDLRKLNVSTSSTGTFINTIGTTPITGSSTAYIPKDYVDFSRLSGYNLDAPTYSIPDYDVAMAIAIKELQNQPIYNAMPSVLSNQKNVNHQEAIVLKSKSNKRKLITI